MDKKKRAAVLSGAEAKKKLWDYLCFSARAVCGTVFCVLGMWAVLFLAKSGSPVLYYAVAFASPGSAIEVLSTEPEEPPVLSTETADSEQNLPENGETPATNEENAETAPKKEIPEVPENRRGTVTEIQYSFEEGGIYIGFGNAIIKNCTSHSAEKIKSKLEHGHSLSLSTETDFPQVFVYHTHATEAFEPADRGYFDLAGSWRSTDPTENMVSVGDVFADTLAEKGISVLHSGTMHDDPSYSGSYDRSAVTVSSAMEENSELTVFLDLHRDAMEPSETEIIKPTAVINGKKAAQIMIIAGCDNGKMNMPDYWENLRFAAALADKLEELYPGICRPILFDYRKYNLDLSPGLLLIEIGSTGNTLEEAQYSAELLANALFELLAE